MESQRRFGEGGWVGGLEVGGRLPTAGRLLPGGGGAHKMAGGQVQGSLGQAGRKQTFGGWPQHKRLCWGMARGPRLGNQARGRRGTRVFEPMNKQQTTNWDCRGDGRGRAQAWGGRVAGKGDARKGQACATARGWMGKGGRCGNVHWAAGGPPTEALPPLLQAATGCGPTPRAAGGSGRPEGSAQLRLQALSAPAARTAPSRPSAAAARGLPLPLPAEWLPRMVG